MSRKKLTPMPQPLHERLNPAKLGFSPRMTAIVGAILGHDYGVHDVRGNKLVGLSITSDGFVIAHTDPISSGAFLGDADELKANLSLLLHTAKFSEKDTQEFWEHFAKVVKDWRR